MIGRLSLIPRMLAFSAVQRQTAASRSTRPSSKEQQGFFGGLPRLTLIKPLSTLAQTPSLRASMGHLPLPEEEPGVLGLAGFGVGLLQVRQAPVRVKKRRLRARKRAAEAEGLDAMATKCPQTPECSAVALVWNFGMGPLFVMEWMVIGVFIYKDVGGGRVTRVGGLSLKCCNGDKKPYQMALGGSFG